MGALWIPKQEKTKLERNATALGHCADQHAVQASATAATRREGTALGSQIG